MAKTNTAIDEVGRPTSDAANKIRDSKSQSVQNHASNQEVAKRAANYVHNLLGRMEMSRHNIQDKFTVWYALWNGSSVADYFPTARPVHVPEPYKAVEGFVPRAASLLVEQPGWFRVVGMDDRGKKNAEVIKKLLMAQLKNDGFYTKFRNVLRNTAIYGYSPAKCFWKKIRRKMKYNKVEEKPSQDENKPGEELKLTRGVETTINEDGPTMELIDVFDFLVDYRFPDHQRSPGIVFRTEQFEDEVKAMGERGLYANVDELLAQDTKEPEKNVQGPPGTIANPATFKDIRDFGDGVSIDTRQEKASYRIYEIYEFWGKFDKDYDHGQGDKGEEKEYVITLGRQLHDPEANGGWVCLRVAENPFWHCKRPAIVSHYTRRAHVFHSVGLIEPIVNLSAELDDSRNMGLAARGLASKPVIIASDDADVYSQNLVLDPGTVIRARNTDALKALFIPDRSDTAWKAEEIIKGDIRETTGIISTYQGTSEAASETATSVVNRTREANKRIAEVAKNIAEGFLVPMLEMFHSMNQQMITKERLVELIGEDGLTVDVEKISPEEVAGMVGFEIVALPEIEVAGLKARMIDAFTDRAIAIEQMAPGTTRLQELLKMSYTAQFGRNEYERVFPNADAPLKLRSATDEHYIIGMGHEVDVQEGENYMAHFEAHKAMAASETFKKWPEDSKRKLLAHMMTTKARLDAEMESAMPRVPPDMMGQPMDPNQPQQGGQPPQAGGPPQPQGPGGMAPPQGGGIGPVDTVGQVRSQAISNAPRTPTEGAE